MDQSQIELLIRAIKQTVNEANAYFERGRGDADSIIRNLQRLEVIISNVEFEDEEFQQHLLNLLCELSVELDDELHDETQSESESDRETSSEEEGQIDAESEETLPSIRISRISNGTLPYIP